MTKVKKPTLPYSALPKIGVLITIIQIAYCPPPSPIQTPFIYNNMECKVSKETLGVGPLISCKLLDSSVSTINKLPLPEFKRRYGVPFQLTDNQFRIVEVGGLRWIQNGFNCLLTMGKKYLKIDDLTFNELYSQKYRFQSKKAVLGKHARCSAQKGTLNFDCELPWGRVKSLPRRKFLSLFLKKNLGKNGDDSNQECESYDIQSFWSNKGELKKCWNGYVWPARASNSGQFAVTKFQFESQNLPISRILGHQPHKKVDTCAFNSKLSRLIKLFAWFCDKNTYYSEKREYKIKTQTKKTRFIAILSSSSKTRYLSKRQIVYIFFGKDIESKNSKIIALADSRGGTESKKHFQRRSNHNFNLNQDNLGYFSYLRKRNRDKRRHRGGGFKNYFERQQQKMIKIKPLNYNQRFLKKMWGSTSKLRHVSSRFRFLRHYGKGRLYRSYQYELYKGLNANSSNWKCRKSPFMKIADNLKWKERLEKRRKGLIIRNTIWPKKQKEKKKNKKKEEEKNKKKKEIKYFNFRGVEILKKGLKIAFKDKKKKKIGIENFIVKYAAQIPPNITINV